jgi:hypothetical protein
MTLALSVMPPRNEKKMVAKMLNLRCLIPAVADGLLLYELNLVRR